MRNEQIQGQVPKRSDESSGGATAAHADYFGRAPS
jgi:hypothetical protein